eukprot:2255082-Prymnesium_polylepis.1
MRPHVAARRAVMRPSGHVCGCAGAHVARRAIGLEELLPLPPYDAQPKIDQRHLAVRSVEHEVLQFKVAVADRVGVAKVDRVEQLPQDALRSHLINLRANGREERSCEMAARRMGERSVR